MSSASQASADTSLGARQSLLGDSDPPEPTLGAFGMADRLNWLVPEVPERFRAMAKIRYRNEPAWAEVRLIEEDRMTVEFDEPQFGVAPGQAVVLYQSDRVLGGGWIL